MNPQTIRQLLEEKVSQAAGLPAEILIPPDPKLGDYASNIAFVLGKKENKKPVEVAEDLKSKLDVSELVTVEVSPNGFLNFYLKPEFLQQQLLEISKNLEYGKNKQFDGKTVMIEYTDPNPFKLFHIGHLMPNIIGESLARLYEISGAKVLRVNYQGDVGLHVAKTVWAILKVKLPFKLDPNANVSDVITLLGNAYTLGNEAYESGDETAKQEIESTNKAIYEKSDPKINEIYDFGKEMSLKYFETIYQKLGTKFDYNFFESEMAPIGLTVVKNNPEIFKESNGAMVFEGEPYGLHTRVFVNSKGLPTYEAKELGLNKFKFETYHPDTSIIVTGNEINDYFRVLLKVMELTMPEVAKNTKHLGHGMLRLTTGKMSSRKGNIITADSLIAQTKERLPDSTPEENKEKIAIGAIKYSILRQTIGQDIIFDFAKSLSISGDAGPYLQYTYARLNNIVSKAGVTNLNPDITTLVENAEKTAMKQVLEFPESIQESIQRTDPHYVTSYLYSLAAVANQFYEKVHVLNPPAGGENSARRDARLVLIKTVARILKDGLALLGIETLDRI
jgi:arginyl-tRNA synthetase